MRVIIDAIRAIRNRRAEMNVPPSRKAKLYIRTEKRRCFENKEHFFVKLANASQVELTDERLTGNAVQIITDSAEIFIPMSEIIDIDAERERLTKELEAAQKEIDRAQSKLNNPEFTSKAPEKVVNAERDKVKKYSEIKIKIEEALAKL